MSMSGLPPGFIPSYETCHEVSAYCPVKATTIGYAPVKGLNIFLAAGYALAAVITLGVGVWKRTWSFSLSVAAGCILECVGYVGRALLADNPWNGDAFKIQIVALVLAPTLICVGLYLTLKHAVTNLNRSLSRLSPKLYPAIFVPADVSCLIVQAIGGGVAAAAGRDSYELLQHGNRTIIAGIVLQVVVLGFFGALAGDYLFRAARYFGSGGVTAQQEPGAMLWVDKKFRMFLYAMAVAYTALMIRCIYRIAEMAGGWGNHIMQDEPSFVVLESFMVLIASLLLAVFAPGIFFPQMSRSGRARGDKEGDAGMVTGTDTPGTEMEHL
ncbi:RTA1 like protein [Canariomyces notabilis]|uniref:RTA1 like protein n=1 Tax=Canariomyces notabilis TaxID=2074819 RepID=A0AAN6TEU2_9PEZI|nr:RTA1 like protein [Canariomyces arenarius]